MTHDDLADATGPDRQPDDGLPRLERETDALTAIARRLASSATERPSIEHDLVL